MIEIIETRLDYCDFPLSTTELIKMIELLDIKAHLILQYSEELDAFLIYAKYRFTKKSAIFSAEFNNLFVKTSENDYGEQGFLGKEVVRPVYSQRNNHRHFKSLSRALDWGKKTGFVTFNVHLDYDTYGEQV